MMNIKKLENAYYTKDNILDFLTEDDIAIFACLSKDFENSKVLNVHIIDREKDVINCWIFDEFDRKIFLKLTPFITYVIKYENFEINYAFWKNAEIYWQAYLYRLFGSIYMDIIKKRDTTHELSVEKYNELIDKETMYQNAGVLLWPHVYEKNLGRKRY